MSAATPAVPPGLWVALAGLLLAGGLALGQLGTLHRPLADYPHLTGSLQTASLEYLPGKNGYQFILFTLAGSPQRFGLPHQGPAMLARLTPLLNGPDLTVYAEAPGALLPNDVNFDVVQLEAPGQVLVAVADTRGQATSHFVWLLLALAVALPLTLKYYLDYRAARRDDSL